MIPEGFSIGPVFIYFYGILIMLGVLAAAFLSARLAPRFGQDPERVWDMLTWLLIAGIIGARLWHVFTPTPSNIAQGLTPAFYLTHPLDLINLRKGGLGIPGAVIGGVLALWIYTRKNKLSFTAWLDTAAPGLILAQAIGRWGNFFNQEVYGQPSDLPWAITIDALHRVPGYESFERFHPLFLYECIANLLIMAFLIWVGARKKDWLKSGDVFLFYLVGYPVVRFLLEFLRLDSSEIAGINANQTFMAVIAVAAVIALVVRHRRQAPPAGELE